MSDYLTSLITRNVAPAGEVRPRVPPPFAIEPRGETGEPLASGEDPALGEMLSSGAGWLSLLTVTELPAQPGAVPPAAGPDRPAPPARRAIVPRPPLRASTPVQSAPEQPHVAAPLSPVPTSRPLAHAAREQSAFRTEPPGPQPEQPPAAPAAPEQGVATRTTLRGQPAGRFQRFTILAARQTGVTGIPRQEAAAAVFPNPAAAGLASPAARLPSAAPAGRASPAADFPTPAPPSRHSSTVRQQVPPPGAAVVPPLRSSRAPGARDGAPPVQAGHPDAQAPASAALRAEGVVLLRPYLPPEPRLPAPQRKSTPEQSIHITIGRIEIRANPAAPARASAARPTQPRLLTLAEYQRQRNAEGNRP